MAWQGIRLEIKDRILLRSETESVVVSTGPVSMVSARKKSSSQMTVAGGSGQLPTNMVPIYRFRFSQRQQP
jgi:hypothetical protein